MEEQRKAEACYLTMYDGMLHKDRKLLEDALDESFVLIHMTGGRQTREEFIKAIEGGVLNYYSAEHHLVQATVQDTSGTLCGQTLVVAGGKDGGKTAWRLQLNCTLICKGDEWKLTEAKASTY